MPKVKPLIFAGYYLRSLIQGINSYGFHLFLRARIPLQGQAKFISDCFCSPVTGFSKSAIIATGDFISLTRVKLVLCRETHDVILCVYTLEFVTAGKAVKVSSAT